MDARRPHISPLLLFALTSSGMDAFLEETPKRYVQERATSDFVSHRGHVPPGPHRTGRNKSCPCGSGKKYKKCCLKK